MNHVDKQYLELLDLILKEGVEVSDRTGTGTYSIFGHQMRFNTEGKYLPILTTKKVLFKAVLHELLWFLRGDTNIKYLVDNGVNIWNDWPYAKFKEARDAALGMNMATQSFIDINSQEKFVEKIKTDSKFAEVWGELGPVYGEQMVAWKNFEPKDEGMFSESGSETINQIQNAVDLLKNNPDSRRIMVSMWNPSYIEDMALPPCHYSFQLKSVPDLDTGTRKLHLLFNQRSVDCFLGAPFNISSYGALLFMFSHVTNHTPGDLIMSTGDTHIYKNHIEQVKLQLTRKGFDELPELKIKRKVKSIFDLTFDDFELVGYKHESFIKAPIAV